MRNLTRDIVSAGQIYEPPLVHDDHGILVVYDGNRRTTCLKLLLDPERAPTLDWKIFFKGQRAEWKEALFPEKIQCQIETDRDRIDEILFRRHTGGQGGVGQSQWDPQAKSNFVQRTGKKEKINVAEEIEEKLKSSGFISRNNRIPRSNLNRLLSSESLRNRVGISLIKNEIHFTHEEEITIKALSKIANDLISKNIVLEDIWSNTGKNKYLNQLDGMGILPKIQNSLQHTTPFHSTSKRDGGNHNKNKNEKTIKLNKPKEQRKHLIRNIDYGIKHQVHTQRAMDIWNELQYSLKFGEHDNAIAVLIRVLLEFSVENYLDRNPEITAYENEKLGKKFKKALDHMHNENKIDKKYHELLLKFETTEAICSANTMNKYIHHTNFFPSDLHLKSMWDTLAKYITNCLKE